MVNYGLRDLGYQYVIIDDCWSEGRNESGYLVANSLKISKCKIPFSIQSLPFPHLIAVDQGMKYVADKIHNLGLKFGIYSSAGIYNCGKYPGSLGYETKDA